MPKGRSRYVYIAIPQELAEKIDEVINSERFGYRSRGEFVVEAVRKRLEELGYLK